MSRPIAGGLWLVGFDYEGTLSGSSPPTLYVGGLATAATVTPDTSIAGYYIVSVDCADVSAGQYCELIGGTVTTEFGTLNIYAEDVADVLISSRLSSAGYTTPPTAAAIADAVWDEPASEHATAGSFGQTVADALSSIVALALKFTGITSIRDWLRAAFGKTADATTLAEIQGGAAATFDNASDSLEAIRDRGDAAWTGGGSGGPVGSGADLCTLRIVVDGSAVPDADVWISSDAGGETIVAGTLQTNSSGEVQFLLDDGETYYLWMQKDGINPIIGFEFEAEAD